MVLVVKRRKKCTKCGKLKKLTEFSTIKAHHGRRERLASWCSGCVAERQRPVNAAPGEPKCGIPDCPRREARSGYCAKHYKLLYRNGDATLQKRASSTFGKSAAARKQWLQEYKLEKGCTDCGYNKHSAALDFDHLPGTVKKEAIRSGASFGWVALLEEIMKCEVVCSNCHRIRTYERRREVMPVSSHETLTTDVG